MRLGLGEQCLGLVEVLLGDEVLGAQGAGALGVEFDQGVVGAGIGEFGAGGAQSHLVAGGIDAGEQVALFDHRVVIDFDLQNQTRDLRADFHIDDRLEGAGGGDRLDDVAAGDLGGGELGLRAGAALQVIVDAAGEDGDEREN